MTKSHLAHLAAKGLLVLLAGLPLASHAGEPLIVVEDGGGTSALPYYEALNLQPRVNSPARPQIPTPQVPATPADEAAMLPVRSAKLTPGTVARRVIEHQTFGLSWSSATTRLPKTGCGAMRPRCTSAARSAWWSMSRPCRHWRGYAH